MYGALPTIDDVTQESIPEAGEIWDCRQTGAEEGSAVVDSVTRWMHIGCIWWIIGVGMVWMAGIIFTGACFDSLSPREDHESATRKTRNRTGTLGGVGGRRKGVSQGLTLEWLVDAPIEFGASGQVGARAGARVTKKRACRMQPTRRRAPLEPWGLPSCGVGARWALV
jgi:hypothetical protein